MGFRSARVKAGLLVAEITKKLGVSDAAVYQWETGVTTPNHGGKIKRRSRMNKGEKRELPDSAFDFLIELYLRSKGLEAVEIKKFEKEDKESA